MLLQSFISQVCDQGVWVWVLAPFPISCSCDHIPEEAAGVGSSSWVSATYMGGQDWVPDSWFWFGLVLDYPRTRYPCTWISLLKFSICLWSRYCNYPTSQMKKLGRSSCLTSVIWLVSMRLEFKCHSCTLSLSSLFCLIFYLTFLYSVWFSTLSFLGYCLVPY